MFDSPGTNNAAANADDDDDADAGVCGVERGLDVSRWSYSLC